MPEVESFRFPSREGRCNEQDQEELEVCSGRRRTCALLNSPLPCVNKAFQNIQELKVTVEHWYQQPGKRQKEIGQDKHRYNKAFRFPSRDNESVTSAELFIEDSCPLSPLLKKINDVLREVVCLIERLEADRQYAEDALHKEQRIKRFLENKVDSMSVWKQQEHSVVVQKEHEACLRDITELKWQLKLESEKLDRAQEKLSHTERLNRRLHEDISFSKKQIPIVKENLALQSNIINQINTTQAEADALLLKMHHDLELIQHEFKKMELDTSVEKMSLDSELLRKRKNQLVKRLKDLNQLKMHEKGLCAEIKDAERTIVLTEEKNVEITQRILEIMEVEKTEKEAIFQLKLQIEEELQQNMKLKEKVISLQEDIEKTRIHGQTEVSFIEEELNSKRKAFSAFQNESMEYEHNIDAYKRKLLESEKAVKQMHEERKQMLQKIIDNDKHVEKAKEEVTQVVAQHSAIQNKLEKQEQLIVTEERRARVEIEKLRRDPTGQTAVLGLLEDKCATINEELHRFNRSSEITNQNLQKEFQDASSEAGAQETKLGKIKKLTENLEKMQCEHRNTLVKLDKEKELRCVYLKAAQDLHTATIKRHDGTIGRISDLTRKSQECRAALVKMEKIAESLPGVIADLQGVFDVVESKNKSAALIMSTLQSDINNCQQRTQRSMQTHTAHVTAGKKELEGTKNSLIFALIENKHLARRYEDLQKILMEAKQEELSAFGKKKHIHVSFHFYKQLSLLQKRMHKAMVKYFKHRSLYSQAELDRCQALSRETDQKIKTVQEGLSEEIQLISTFLQHLTDDSTTSSDAGVNKQASPDAEWK